MRHAHYFLWRTRQLIPQRRGTLFIGRLHRGVNRVLRGWWDNLMPQYLALDIGQRRTGVAIGDSALGISFPCPTITHSSVRDLVSQVLALVSARDIAFVFVGLPLLPSGNEGAQARFVRRCVELLKRAGIFVQFIDERYSSHGHGGDNDAQAACAILSIAFASFAKKNNI